MRRRIAVVGDELICGGWVLDYEQKHGFTFHGHKTALIGNEAFCEVCKSTGKIAKSGGPYRLSYDGVREAALDGDIVLCQCPTPPRIVAHLAQESWVEDRAGESVIAVPPQSARTAESIMHIYDQRFHVTNPRTGQPLRDTPYRIVTDDGEEREGRTDTHGYTECVAHDQAILATLHVYEEVTSLNPDWDKYQ
jgi:hypothetical protein